MGPVTAKSARPDKSRARPPPNASTCSCIGTVGNAAAKSRSSSAAADIGTTAYAGTPDYLKIILDKADELGVQLGFTRAVVGGGALFPSLRQLYADRGIATLQCYATADLGSIAYESEAMDGMIVDEGVIVEIVRPGTGDPVPAGEVGEVLVTTLNPDYPLVRFGTGDMSAVLAGAGLGILGARRPNGLVSHAVSLVAIAGNAAPVFWTGLMLLVTDHPLDKVLFEVTSAFGTVGLSAGITADIPPIGQVLLILLMFIGRLGPITFASALALRERRLLYELPKERPIIG